MCRRLEDLPRICCFSRGVRDVTVIAQFLPARMKSLGKAAARSAVSWMAAFIYKVQKGPKIFPYIQQESSHCIGYLT